MTHVLTGAIMMFMVATLAVATTNNCELIAIELREAVKIGTLTQAQADEILGRCDEELWG